MPPDSMVHRRGTKEEARSLTFQFTVLWEKGPMTLGLFISCHTAAHARVHLLSLSTILPRPCHDVLGLLESGKGVPATGEEHRLLHRALAPSNGCLALTYLICQGSPAVQDCWPQQPQASPSLCTSPLAYSPDHLGSCHEAASCVKNWVAGPFPVERCSHRYPVAMCTEGLGRMGGQRVEGGHSCQTFLSRKEAKVTSQGMQHHRLVLTSQPVPPSSSPPCFREPILF